MKLATNPYQAPKTDDVYKAKTGIPKEAQELFQRRRQMLKSDLQRQKQAQQRALQQRLSLTGLGASGIAEKQQRNLESEFARQRERGEEQIHSAEQQYALQYGEAERGREFQSSEAAKQRAIQQDALNLQKALGLGYEGPSGWVKGTAEIANIELQESLRNDVTNAIQALKDLGMDDLTKMRPFLEAIYGEDRVGGIYADLDALSSDKSKGYDARVDAAPSGSLASPGTIIYGVRRRGLDPGLAVDTLVNRFGYTPEEARKAVQSGRIG